jgi:2-polyprenyl-3-methyl-5-hydroxy-6-metoxy-1,4-benzoquinol methylase
MKLNQLPPHQIGSRDHLRLALKHFKPLNPYFRNFARFKILLDPMFPRLADFVSSGWKMIDIGCGFGIQAAWLLAVYPDLKFLSCDPDGERVKIASRVLGDKGRVLQCGAMDLSLENERADAVLCIDVLHYLSDWELQEFLKRVRKVLPEEGKLIIRLTVPGNGFHIFRMVEIMKLRIKGVHYYFRDVKENAPIIESSGFKLELVEPTAPGREETWFIAGLA